MATEPLLEMKHICRCGESGEETVKTPDGMLPGLALGSGTAEAISLFGVSVLFSLWPPVLAFCPAVLTGPVFGFLPARKAARLDPVIALPSE